MLMLSCCFRDINLAGHHIWPFSASVYVPSSIQDFSESHIRGKAFMATGAPRGPLAGDESAGALGWAAGSAPCSSGWRRDRAPRPSPRASHGSRNHDGKKWMILIGGILDGDPPNESKPPVASEAAEGGALLFGAHLPFLCWNSWGFQLGGEQLWWSAFSGHFFLFLPILHFVKIGILGV